MDARLAPLLLRGDLTICGVIELEMLFAARASDVQTARLRLQDLGSIPMEQAHFDRAAEILTSLADEGKHRAVGVADLLVAACAEQAHLTLLHYDSDFETIALVTGQATEWVVPRGSVA